MLSMNPAKSVKIPPNAVSLSSIVASEPSGFLPPNMVVTLSLMFVNKSTAES